MQTLDDLEKEFQMEFCGYKIHPGQQVALDKLVASVARLGMTVIELGCWAGSTSQIMLQTIKQNHGRLYCVDWFRGSIETTVGGHGFSDEPRFDILKAFMGNIIKGGYKDDVTVIVESTVEASRLFYDNFADMILIAADHRYQPVINDIQLYWPRLRPGGIFCGTAFERRIEKDDPEYDRMISESDKDYNAHFALHFGAIRAVQESFGKDFEHEEHLWWTGKK